MKQHSHIPCHPDPLRIWPQLYTSLKITAKSLYGYWSLEGVTWLKITSDSIYFVDEEGTSPIKYSTNKDTIIWYFDGIIQKSKYNIVQDTLFMKNEEGTTQYIRVNEKR